MFRTLSSIAALVVLVGAALGQINFTVAPFYATANNNPQWLELADMDGDGDLDAVTVEPEDEVSTVSVSKNLGGGVYGPAVSYPADKSSQNLAVGDFNGDNRPDVVVSNRLSGDGSGGNLNSVVTVYMNNGTGGLVGRVDLSVGENAHPQEVEIADFDMDGRNDFAVASMNESRVYIYRSLGNGSFSLYRVIQSSDSASYLDSADVNADGRPDLIVGNVDASFIWRNTPTAFVMQQWVNNFPDGVQGVAAADFDGDGDKDFVTSGRFLTYYRNTGGTFTKVGSYLTGEALAGLRAADIDGDGDQDVIGALYLANSFSVYHNNGSADFSDRRDWGVGDNPWNVAVGDVNGDGRLDVVAPSSNYNAQDFHVALNAGAKNFVARREYFLIGDAAGAEIGDVDGDGFNDIVSGVYVSNQDRVAVFFGKADGSQEDAVYIENIGNNIPTDVAIADFNNDGKLDIAASIFSPGNMVRVWINQGNRQFAPSVALHAGGNPSGVTTGDLNGDGWIDVVNTNGSQLDNSIHVFFNNGNGTFAAGIRIDTLFRPSDASIADWDRDGDNDVMVTHGGSTGVLLFKNNGTGSLTPTTINIGKVSGNPVAADLNNDGWMDAVISTGDTTSLINNQSGGFTIITSSVPNGRVSAADYDGDGYIDMAGTAGVAALVHVGRNDGTGRFVLATSLKSGYSPDRSASGDLNGDGMPEIAVANGRGGSVSVFTNRTDGAMTVAPSAYQWALGHLPTGTLQDLLFSDNRRIAAERAPIIRWVGPNVVLNIEGVAPAMASGRIEVELEASSNLHQTTGTRQRIELYNFVTQQWVLVDDRMATLEDSVVVAGTSVNAGQYIEPGTFKVRARVLWSGQYQVTRGRGSSVDRFRWKLR